MISLVILVYALFASIFGLSKDTLNYSEPFFLVGSRMLFAGLLLLGHQFFFNRKAFQLKAAHIKSLFLLGFICIYITNAAEIWGIQHMFSAKACLIYSLSPFLAAIIAYFVLKERLSKQKWMGLVIGFMGLIPVLLPTLMGQSTADSGSQTLPFIALPEMVVLVGVFASVYGWTLLKKVVSEYHYTPLMANGISMTIGGSLALLHSYFTGEAWSPLPVSAWGPFIQNSLLMCLISNMICYNLYGYLLKRYTATFMSFAGLVTPFFASFFGWYFLGETITWHYFASIIVFSIGLSIFYQAELKRDKLFVPSPGAARHPLPRSGRGLENPQL